MYGSQVELSALYQAYNSCYQLRKLRWWPEKVSIWCRVSVSSGIVVH
jgi:hypothetical protein